GDPQRPAGGLVTLGSLVVQPGPVRGDVGELLGNEVPGGSRQREDQPQTGGDQHDVPAGTPSSGMPVKLARSQDRRGSLLLLARYGYERARPGAPGGVRLALPAQPVGLVPG